MLQLADVRDAEGMDVTDPEGNRIGRVETIYLDNDTDQPEFALVNTGMFGSRSSFVPLRDAHVQSGRIEVPHRKDEVKDAPSIEADEELNPDEVERIYQFYGLGGTAGAETGTRTDDAMTRSEEELHVGTTPSETGRVRLRKFVETEPVTERVQTRHEEAHIEREPITEANVDQATAGAEISEAEHEVTLRSEEPVVEKRTVPKERVRLEKETSVDEEEVTEELRKERLETTDEPPA